MSTPYISRCSSATRAQRFCPVRSSLFACLSSFCRLITVWTFVQSCCPPQSLRFFLFDLFISALPSHLASTTCPGSLLFAGLLSLLFFSSATRAQRYRPVRSVVACLASVSSLFDHCLDFRPILLSFPVPSTCRFLPIHPFHPKPFVLRLAVDTMFGLPPLRRPSWLPAFRRPAPPTAGQVQPWLFGVGPLFALFIGKSLVCFPWFASSSSQPGNQVVTSDD